MSGERLLLVAAGILTLDPDGRTAERAVLLAGERIVWVGGAPSEAPPHDRAVDLGGAWLTPAFVDAHVHATATGLALAGVDLTGSRSAAEALQRLRHHATRTDGPVLLGYGWEDQAWPEGRPMTAAEVSAAAPGRIVLLDRVDVHSCVVDERTLRALPLRELPGVDRDAQRLPTGWLREEAAGAAREQVRAALTPEQLAGARRTVCRRAAALGIGSMHEMGHPGISGYEDARAWADGQRRGEWDVEVIVWWADIDPELPCLQVGLRPGGDLFLDGSIGSRTAAVSSAYPDGSTGELFHDDDSVTRFFLAATRAGIGAGVHAIGDRAIDQAVRAIAAAADAAGADPLRGCRHRVEHVELPTPDHIRTLASLGVVASVQPAFDAAWGGAEGLYAQRFGTDVAFASNPFALFAESGCPMAFGSDSTVTPLDPWGAVHAAEHHRGGLGLSRAGAIAAHVRGGRHVAHQEDTGTVSRGKRADLAVWDDDPLRVGDVRDLGCLATVVAGRVVHGSL